MAAELILVETTDTVIVEVATQGPQGTTGPTGATGPGVPAGGSAGQILSKIDGTDYNTQWITDTSTMTEGDVIALIVALS